MINWSRRQALLLFAGFSLLLVGLVAVRANATADAAAVNVASSMATLTLGKVTDPAGAEDFPLTAVGFRRSIRTTLRSPRDIERDTDGRLYVVGRRTSRVAVYSPAGTLLQEFGSKGNGPAQLLFPESIALSPTEPDRLYITDTGNDRIQIFTTAGAHVGGWGETGTGPGQFSSPMGITIDDAGNVYVTDTFNHRIQKFTADGTFLLEWGSQGGGDSQFFFPAGLDVDAAGEVYVTDSNNHRIRVFSSDGQFLRGWGSEGTGFGQFNLPADLHVDDGGAVYVSDTYNERIQKFTSDGRYLATWGEGGSGDGQFQRPNGLVIDSTGLVYVVDIDNQRVEIFSQATVFLDDGRQESLSLPAGEYSISEPPRSGWVLAAIDCVGQEPATRDGSILISLTDGETTTCTFTNRAETTTGDVAVQVYDDTNQDGQLTAGEPGLAGWTVRLRDAANSQIGDDATTDEAGAVLFAAVPLGDYVVCQVLPTGWLNTEPGDEGAPVSGSGLELCSPVVLAGASVSVRFGNYEKDGPPPPPVYRAYLPVAMR